MFKTLAVMPRCGVYKVFFSVFALCFPPGAVVKCRANKKKSICDYTLLEVEKTELQFLFSIHHLGGGGGVGNAKYAFSNLRNNNVLLVDRNPILYFQSS